jgi:hypothetical protein
MLDVASTCRTAAATRTRASIKLQPTPTNPDLARNFSIEVERGQMKGKRLRLKLSSRPYFAVKSRIGNVARIDVMKPLVLFTGMPKVSQG